MTNALEITNSPVAINGLDVVKQVDEFYSTAFDHILWLLGTLILLLGIAVPLAFYFFQKRQLMLKEQSLAEKLEKEIKQQSKMLTDLTKTTLQAEKETITVKLAELKMQLKTETAEAMGSMYHLQGVYNQNNGMHVLAIESYTAAIEEYTQAKNLKCVQQMLTLIAEYNLSRMNKPSFEDSDIVTHTNRAISVASEISCKGLLDVSIKNLKKALVEAQKRELPAEETA